MVFITTGQRIATENFEEGKIYKVVLINGNTVYFMCTGIGTDFVMLQSDEPRLFALTMQSAAQVSTIDLYDPTPPAPPTPISNCLQYQTGAPPFNFRTTESKLFSWYIAGPAGDRTANLLDISLFATQYSQWCSYANDTLTITGVTTTMTTNGITVDIPANTMFTVEPLEVENGIVNARFKFEGNDGSQMIYLYNENGQPNTISPISFNFAINKITFSWSNASSKTAAFRFFMINSGSRALPYEPYGLYKISIQTNSRTDTIYLDSPLAEGEKLYSVNTDTEIITTIGDNSLSITTPTQPPEMQIVYGIYAEA